MSFDLLCLPVFNSNPVSHAAGRNALLTLEHHALKHCPTEPEVLHLHCQHFRSALTAPLLRLHLYLSHAVASHT